MHPSPERAFTSPLGWDWIPHASNAYPISPAQLPRLSHAETLLVQRILAHIETIPESSFHPTQLQQIIRDYCTQNHLLIEREQECELMRVLEWHTLPGGILQILLQDPTLEEIAIAGIGETFPVRVWVAGEGWRDTPLYFTDAAPLITQINRLALHAGKRLSHATPTLNARLHDGSRLHASMPPVCVHAIELTIRKFVFRTTDATTFMRTSVIAPRPFAFLQLAMQADANLLLIGNTGSGKTTSLNVLLSCLPAHERFILVEETPELQLAQPHQIRLTPSSSAKLEMAELIRETLRMRPDRVVVGEIRFPEEAKAFMESVLAGQGKGTYATFHGYSAAEALARLRQFGILEQDLGWLNLIVTQKRWTQHQADHSIKEMRAICEINEIIPTKQGKLKLNPIFLWDTAAQQLLPKNKSQLICQKWEWNYPHSPFNEHWQQLTHALQAKKPTAPISARGD
ncbi:MAG: CpaF family protein [Candidatus Iainarchaeum archaeon]|uniref:CpaF family protein n=1 Tax=Candidatus Iainarchaeum sp. TaxID=3101447 RepID=A0A7T9DJ01_9ARCH|nr:MAG: CpaF family protein [Candidatus Diapherotrites archaeon]